MILRRDRPAPPGPGGEVDPPVSPRTVTTVLAGAVLVLLVLALLLVPLPYAVWRPGPTVDTLSEVDDVPLIEVAEATTYPTSGELRLTTISTLGGPGYPVTAVDVLGAWLADDELVRPVESVFPQDVSREELDEQSTVQMTSSQTNATVAALTELGHEVPAVLEVRDVVPEAPAHGVVLPGDVLTSLRPAGGERTDLETFADLSAVLDTIPPGTSVVLGLEREGQEVDVEVSTMAPGPHTGGAETEGSVLGLLLRPDLDLPVDISIAIENIGGSSAGTMFALGIIDVLTPGAMTGGERIAGTGTMSLDGRVGPISGVRQKLAGAARDGADWFLAPVSNCDEVSGHVPDGLQVVAVRTLGEARDAVDAIADGEGQGLPGCSS
ncbi:signal protein PDZ [Georgenia sp. 10Sc9-8]|uniref:Signal protein PDZ n=1 Tax=Georgenia halotolerans TaxID=3028317 RepID=A0ABT5TW58_9MICO|nr:signal protein PDZ [Georgenia halotolerans]